MWTKIKFHRVFFYAFCTSVQQGSLVLNLKKKSEVLCHVSEDAVRSHLRLNPCIVSCEDRMRRIASGFCGASLGSLKIRIKVCHIFQNC